MLFAIIVFVEKSGDMPGDPGVRIVLCYPGRCESRPIFNFSRKPRPIFTKAIFSLYKSLLSLNFSKKKKKQTLTRFNRVSTPTFFIPSFDDNHNGRFLYSL